MLKIVRYLIVIFAAVSVSSAAFAASQVGGATKLPFFVYPFAADSRPVYTPSGFMGDTKDIRLVPGSTAVKGRTSDSCLQVNFTAKSGWGGVAWLSPVSDWGTSPGGLNLSGAKKLVVWCRGDKGGEVVTFKYGIIDNSKKFHDTSSGELDSVKLTTHWTKYTINLSGKNLQDIKSSFVWVVNSPGHPVTFYLDSVSYE